MNLDGAQSARLQRLRARHQFAIGRKRAGVHHQITQIARIPQDDGLHDAAVDVRLVDVRQRQTDHVDVAAACLSDGFRRSGNGRRRNRHHELHVRVHFHDRLRLGERLVAIVVARPDRRDDESGVLVGDALADETDPLVLVCRAERAGDNSELAAPVQQPRRIVGERVCDSFRRRLVHEKVARVLVLIGVPRKHADSARARFLEHGRDGRAILDGDRNHVDFARDPVLDQLVLLRGVEARRPVPDQLHTERARRFFRAGPAAHEVRIAFRFRHHRDDHAMSDAVPLG